MFYKVQYILRSPNLAKGKWNNPKFTPCHTKSKKQTLLEYFVLIIVEVKKKKDKKKRKKKEETIRGKKRKDDILFIRYFLCLMSCQLTKLLLDNENDSRLGFRGIDKKLPNYSIIPL